MIVATLIDTDRTSELGRFHRIILYEKGSYLREGICAIPKSCNNEYQLYRRQHDSSQPLESSNGLCGCRWACWFHAAVRRAKYSSRHLIPNFSDAVICEFETILIDQECLVHLRWKMARKFSILKFCSWNGIENVSNELVFRLHATCMSMCIVHDLHFLWLSIRSHDTRTINTIDH